MSGEQLNLDEADAFLFVRRLTNSQLESHKQMVSLLAAVEDHIDSKRVQRSPAAYFGALMTVIATNSASGNAQNDDVAGAAFQLLAAIFPRLPHAVLRAKFDDIAAVIGKALQEKSEVQPIMRSALDVLTTTLKAQDGATWTQATTRERLRWLAMFILDPRPKLRKKAHECMRALFVLPEPVGSTALAQAARICQQAVQLQPTTQDAQTILHAIVFLKETLVSLPQQSQDAIVKQLVRLSGLGHTHMSFWIFETFAHTFERLAGPVGAAEDDEDAPGKAPRASDDENEAADQDVGAGTAATVAPPQMPITPLTAAALATILTKIREVRPDKNDAQLLAAWLAAIAQGYRLLAQLDVNVALETVHVAIALVIPLFTSEKTASIHGCSTSLQFLLRHVVRFANAPTGVSDRILNDLLVSVQKSLERCLSYTYQAQWHATIPIVAAAFEALGSRATPALDGIVLLVDDIYRTSFDSAGTALYNAALIACIKRIGKAVGVETLMRLLPLNIFAKHPNVSRPWMLAFLKDAIPHGSPLGFFGSYFLPLIKSMMNAQASAGSIEKKQLHTLVLQTWNLLPAFCYAPSDLAESFKVIAPELGNAITNEVDARPSICSALVTLIETTCKGPIGNTSGRAAVSSMAKNFLPIFFNIFGTTSADRRAFLLDTISAYVSISDKPIVNAFFKSVMTKLLEASTSEQTSSQTQQQAQQYKRHTMMDLSLAMIPQLDEANWIILTRAIFPLLQDEDPVVEKKAYRCLHSLCELHGPAIAKIVAAVAAGSPVPTVAQLQGIEETSFAAMFEAMLDPTLTGPTAKRERMRLLGVIVSSLSADECIQHVPTLLPEVMLCTKEVNEKARQGAFDLLVTITKHMNSLDNIGELLKMVVAGLGGTTTHMVSASISTLARIVFEFHVQLDSDEVDALIKTVLILLRSPSREVVKSSIGFIKVCIVCLSDEEVGAFLPDIVEGLLVGTAPHKLRFRANLKYIFQRLLRKFGYDMVASLVPEEHSKFINGLRKQVERGKRKSAEVAEDDKMSMASTKISKASTRHTKHQAENEESEESDNDEDDLPEILKDQLGLSRGKGKKGTWIRESNIDADDEYGDDDEPMDFLDQRVSSRVTSAKPGRGGSAGGKKLKQEEVAIAPDGRLLFRDDDEEDERDYKNERARGKEATIKRKASKGDKYDQLMAEEDEAAMDDGAGRKKVGKNYAATSIFMNEGDDYDEEDGGNDGDDDAMDIDSKSTKSFKSSSSSKVNTHTQRKRFQKSRHDKPSGARKTAQGVTGDQYRAKKAGGDIKRKDLPDPYAYVPLDPGKLSKRRKQAKSEGTVRNILTAAKRGSQKGSKNHSAGKAQKRR